MLQIKRPAICLLIIIILIAGILLIHGQENDDILQSFLFPSSKHSARVTYVLNGEIDKNIIKDNIMLLSETGIWNGYTFIPQVSTIPYTDSTEFESIFRNMLNITHILESKMSLYENFNYINASTKKLLDEQYPETKAEFLFVEEITLKDGETITTTVPEGILMAAVGMNIETKTLDDLSDCIDNGNLTLLAPKGYGDWKIMFFMCRTLESKDASINYLSKEASIKYIDLTYLKYVNKYPEYLTNTIDNAYFANVSMKNVDEGIYWTHDFNDKFEKKYKVSPTLLYPALLYDIGETTTSAKVSLYSFRAELLSEGFPKAMNEFSSSNKIFSTGNAISFQSLIPTGSCGDYIKFYKNIDIPIFDELSTSNKMIKLVSSASYNYDKKITAASLFEPYEVINKDILYKTIMEAYTKGINSVYLNSVYYSKDMTVNNDLSYLSDLAPTIPNLNAFIARLNTFLQQGDTVVDIAVIYPIETLHASYNINKISRENIPYVDYLDVGDWLHQNIKADFMYLHPEIIEEEGFDNYKTVLLPGCEVISIKTLEKLKEYYKNGGNIIATYQLPTKSSEVGSDNNVREIIEYIFGKDAYNSSVQGRVYKKSNNKGGQAYFIHSYEYGSHEYYKNPDLIELALNESNKVRDVSFKSSNPYGEGYVSYIHKKTNESNIYYIANTGSENYLGTITLRGSFKPSILDPHTGEVIVPEYKHYKLDGNNVTSFKINLDPISSIIIYCGDKISNLSIPLIYKGDYLNLSKNRKIVDDGIFSFNFSLQDNGKIEFMTRESKDENGYLVEIENGRINLYKFSDGTKEVIASSIVTIKTNMYYLFTFSMENDLLTAYLSGNRVFEINDKSFSKGKITVKNIEKAEIGEITVLGDTQKVNTEKVSYTFYLIVLMTIVILKITKKK